ncbi:MAG: hypothetical protein NDJ94_06360 [Vicinamibacteria bacterium]|nr:hypothetical protein [Vicinamibacteria bacterium]
MRNTAMGVLVGLVVLAPVAAAQGARELPFDAAGWEAPAGSLREYAGRLAFATANGHAFRRDIPLQDGTIEFDLRVSGHRSFAYLLFRMESQTEFEELYFRPHKRRLPDTLQYNPAFQGRGQWQLYHGPGATAALDLPLDTWVHVRWVMSGRRGALFVGDDPKPALVVPRLAREPRAGGFALRTFTPGDETLPAGVLPAAFANVVVRPGEIAPEAAAVLAAAVEPAPVAGVQREWCAAPAFAATPGPVLAPPPAGLAWRRVASEPAGFLELTRHVAIPEGARRWATWVALTLEAEQAATARLDLGFSDAVSVFLGDRLLYSGEAGYRFDQPRREGLLALGQNVIGLPLAAGRNELRFAVSDQFGGWALMAKLEAPPGVTVRAECAP